MYFVLYEDKLGYWRWTFYASNHRKIADSGEAYHNRQDCLHAIELIKGSASAPVYQR